MVEGKAVGMGRQSPGHVCRRPRQQHSHGNRSCSQPCRHQKDQQIIQPTIRNSHLHSSGTADTWHHQAVQLVQELGRRATIIRGDSRKTAYLFHFKTRSQPAILLKPVIFTFINFNFWFLQLSAAGQNIIVK